MKYLQLPVKNKKFDFKELIDKRSIMCALITISLILISVFCFTNSYYRLFQALKDFGQTIAYTFCEIFKIPNDIELNINTLNFGFPTVGGAVPILPPAFIPISFDSYKAKLELYLLVFNMDNFKKYFGDISIILRMSLMLILLSVILVVILKLLICRVFNKTNNDYNVDSRMLRIAKNFGTVVYMPIKDSIIGHIEFIKNTKVYWYIWVSIFCISFNIVSIAFSFFAYYFYFAITISFDTLYLQIYKLFVDISPLFTSGGLLISIPIIMYIINNLRTARAEGLLYQFEMINNKFIKLVGIIVMNVGTMGKGKTTLLVSMLLSVQRIHRKKALELMHNYQTMFPNFSWINFELELKRAIMYGQINNLRSAKRFINKKAFRFNKNSNSVKIFDYDFVKYGLEYDDKKSVKSIFEILDNYARCYFIYFISSTLMISNLSIRDDTLVIDKGNFPLFDGDFFNRSSWNVKNDSTYCHILDFDMMRLGQKIIEDNQFNGVLEFFVMGITEIAKERGNQNDLKEVKKSDETANQKNDFFDRFIKLVRHYATIDGYPFAFIALDDQRTGALSTDIVNLVSIVHIDSVTDRKCSLPFFRFYKWFHALTYDKFVEVNGTWDKLRFNRSDNTIITYLLWNVLAAIHRHFEKMYNLYGYKQLTLSIVDGLTGEKKPEQYPYFIINQKDYRNRFATDCYGSLLDSGSDLGLDDIPCYESLYPTKYEYERQHSYFINDVEKFNKKTKK